MGLNMTVADVFPQFDRADVKLGSRLRPDTFT